MKKFMINKELFEKYAGLKIGLVICQNIQNVKLKNDMTKEMDAVKAQTKAKFEHVQLADYPVIRRWRDVYKSFGEKKSRSSVEALIRRTVNGNDIPSINPLVDIYNLISLKYELPCGGEDLDTITADIELTYAKGNESFLSLGETEEEHPNEGEIVYKFDHTVICRNFNYRESDITKLTESTKNAVLVMESIIEGDENLEDALEALSKLVNENLGGKTRTVILSKEQNEIQL